MRDDEPWFLYIQTLRFGLIFFFCGLKSAIITVDRIALWKKKQVVRTST